MCGKFTQMVTWRQVVDFSQPLSREAGKIETVTPMRFASVLLRDENGRRNMVRMRWGYSRRTATAPGNRPDHIHARCETIDSKPTFREAFAGRRGLLFVRTFNEGKEITPRKTQQHTITPNDGQPVAIAVLWEKWENPEAGDLYTFVMVTTPPNKLIGTITDRMPAIVQAGDCAKWLGEDPASPAELKALLVPYEGDWCMEPEKKKGEPPLL